MTVNNRVEI